VLVWEPGKKVPIYAFPRDVDPSLLADSALQTGCPYKGFASYRDVLLNGRRHRGLFWSYQTPLREVTAVKGYLAPRASVWAILVSETYIKCVSPPCLGQRGRRRERRQQCCT